MSINPATKTTSARVVPAKFNKQNKNPTWLSDFYFPLWVFNMALLTKIIWLIESLGKSIIHPAYLWTDIEHSGLIVSSHQVITNTGSQDFKIAFEKAKKEMSKRNIH